MDRLEVVKSFFSSIEKGEWNQVEAVLSDQFYFWGPLPRPLNKEEWLEAQKAFYTAIPDWRFNVEELVEVGNCVNAFVHVSGTHTQPLKLPIPGANEILPTGLKIELPVEKAVITFEGDQILEVALEIGFIEGMDQFLRVLGIKS